MKRDPLPNGGWRAYGPVEGNPLVVFDAHDIRIQSTGVHARVAVGTLEDLSILEEDTFNVGRREDRNRLANAAWKSLPPGIKDAYPQEQLQTDLLLFTRDLARLHRTSLKAERTGGDRERSEPKFIVQDYVLEEAGTILFAPPGRGKSWMGMLLTVSVDAGVGTVFPCKQAPALFVNLERGRDSVSRRLGMVNEVLGLPPTRDVLMLHARGRTLADVWDGLDETVRTEGVKFAMVDSLSRTGSGDMNGNKEANSAMDMLNALPCAWATLAHTPRGDESHVYGSQMFDAAADLTVQMLTQEMDDPDTGAPLLGIGFKVTKANDTPKPPVRIWRLDFDRQFGLMSIGQANRGEFWEIEDSASGGKRTAEEQIEGLLTASPRPMSITQLATALSMNKGTVKRLIDRLVADDRVVFVQEQNRQHFYGMKYR